MKVIFLWLFIISFMSVFAGDRDEDRLLFSNTRLRVKYVSHKNFSGLRLRKIDCSNSSLISCSFRYTKCIEVDFSNSVLDYSDFFKSTCYKAKFNNTDMLYAWLWSGDYRGADFTNSNLKSSIMFNCKIGFEGEDRTIVDGTNFEGGWGLTNIQKQYLRKNGAVNVPYDCDEEEENRKFKEELNKINEELSLFYPLNKWAKGSIRLTKKTIKWLWINKNKALELFNLSV